MFPIKHKPKSIGLVLGGGSARGCAHLGVIKALEEAHISISAISGTSIGALVGAACAAQKTSELTEISTHISWQTILSYLDITWPRQGVLSGEKVLRFLQNLIPEEKIENLSIPYSAVATDITSGEEIVLSSGNLHQAVRASISLPGIFTPVKMGKQLLVDGGLVNPLPINVLKKQDIDFIIAVDLNHDKSRLEDPPSLQDLPREASFFENLAYQYEKAGTKMKETMKHWIKKDEPALFDMLGWSVNIMQDQITQKNLITHPADILIRPKLGHIRAVDFHRAEEMIRIGYEATLPYVERIKEVRIKKEKRR